MMFDWWPSWWAKFSWWKKVSLFVIVVYLYGGLISLIVFWILRMPGD